MSTEIAKEEAANPKALIYKVPPHQLANAALRGINRRRVAIFRDAHKRKALARSAAKRLERDIRRADGPVDSSIIGLCQKLKRIGETRVVGKDWRKPRDGRRL